MAASSSSRRRALGAHPYLVTPDLTMKARSFLGPDSWLLPAQAVVLKTNPDQARAIACRHVSRSLDFPNYTDAWHRLDFADDDLIGAGQRPPSRRARRMG